MNIDREALLPHPVEDVFPGVRCSKEFFAVTEDELEILSDTSTVIVDDEENIASTSYQKKFHRRQEEFITSDEEVNCDSDPDNLMTDDESLSDDSTSDSEVAIDWA